jgi:hypothetical protein
MTINALLLQTAARYEQAVQQVLGEWSPNCGCRRPGANPHCESCPCLEQFEQRIKEKIHLQTARSSSPHSGTESIYENIEHTHLSPAQV